MKLKKILNEITTNADKIKILSFLKNTTEPIVFQNYDKNQMVLTLQLADSKKIRMALQNPINDTQMKIMNNDVKKFINNIGPIEIFEITIQSFK